MLKTSVGARSRARLLGVLSVAGLGVLGTSQAFAQNNVFTPGDILVSSSTYTGDASTLTVGTPLPVTPAANAQYNGVYYQVFNNDLPDANFGLTSPITITQLTPTGASTGVVINVPQSYLCTSFSSKSELGLNLTPDGTGVTFFAYPATANQIDLSNSATPNNNFSGDTDTASATYRAIGKLNFDGSLSTITEVIDYSGDNARNVMLAANGNYYTVGASASSNTALAGAQMVVPGAAVGQGSNSFSLGIYGNKDSQNNFRGMTIYNNTLYVSKGSGGASSSVDTVYQVGTAGTLPTSTSSGNGPNTVSILPGFNTTTQGSIGAAGPHPFGLWFANATTLYVADEGTGVLADVQTGGVASSNGNNHYAGLEKWILNTTTHQWALAYTLTAGLNFGTNYSVSGTSGGVGGTYITAPDGLRNIIGKVNSDGTVTIYTITSTVNGATVGQPATGNYAYDAGCDPNQLVSITDNISFTTASQASSESFNLLQSAAYGQVLRGVSFVPYAQFSDTPTMPQWGLILLAASLIVIAAWFLPKRRSGFIGQ